MLGWWWWWCDKDGGGGGGDLPHKLLEVKGDNVCDNGKPVRTYYVNVSDFLIVIFSAVPVSQVSTILLFSSWPVINKDTSWWEHSYWDCSLQMLSWEYRGASGSWINKPGCYPTSTIWQRQDSESPLHLAQNEFLISYLFFFGFNQSGLPLKILWVLKSDISYGSFLVKRVPFALVRNAGGEESYL